jgi:hypothetical protein
VCRIAIRGEPSSKIFGLTHRQEYKSRGDKILMVGDLNESMDNNCTGMTRIHADFHLVDLMKSRSADQRPLATYSLAITTLWLWNSNKVWL